MVKNSLKQPNSKCILKESRSLRGKSEFKINVLNNWALNLDPTVLPFFLIGEPVGSRPRKGFYHSVSQNSFSVQSWITNGSALLTDFYRPVCPKQCNVV